MYVSDFYCGFFHESQKLKTITRVWIDHPNISIHLQQQNQTAELQNYLFYYKAR